MDRRGKAVSLSREVSTLYANFRGAGIGMAAKYAVFRALFSVHNRPVAWALNRLHPYPILLEVEISTACDLRCTMCENPVRTWGAKKQLMAYEDLVRVLDEFPNLIWIDITGIGEGLVHPRFLDMVGEIKRRGLYLELFDPFHRWTPSVTDFMLDVGLNRIQPSVDGATTRTYEAIRIGAEFRVVCDNLRYLFREKARRKSPLPIVDFHYIVQESNEHEMVAFVDLVRDLASGQRVGIQFTEILREFPGIQAKKVPITEQRMAEVFARARQEGVQVWFNRNSEGRHKADMRQCNAWYMPFIFVDGTVVPCCAQNEIGDRPWQVARSMGNVFQRPFREIWKGKQYSGLRRKMRQGETPDYCEGCPVFVARSRSFDPDALPVFIPGVPVQ